MKGEISGRKPSYGFFSQNAYGMGEFLGGGCFVIINSFFAVFLTKALGMPTALAGTIPMIGKIWDAVTDPIMGNITDRTRSRLGPKRLYILIGSIAAPITFVLMWLKVTSPSVTMMYLFYVVMYCLFSTGFTIFAVPYGGLLPDMMDDYTMRAKFSNIRMVWSTLGAMVCGLVPTLMIRDNLNPAQYLRCAALFGVLFFITCITVFFGTWERQKEPVRSTLKESFPQAMSVFRSRSFCLFMALYLFGQCGMDFISGMAVYYVDDVLNGYQNGYFTYIMGVLMGAQLIGMAIFGPVMSHSSKKMTIMIGAPVRLAGILGMLAVSHEGAGLVPILAFTALVGLGNAGCLTGIFAIMADMTDVDELITSIRRPGIVSSMATFIRKISSGLSAAAIGFLLAAVGYDEIAANAGIRQSAATQHGIAMVFVFAPAVLTLLLIIANLFFPITKKEFQTVQDDIARRKGEKPGTATEEERKILETVTGLSYGALWNPENAGMHRTAE